MYGRCSEAFAWEDKEHDDELEEEAADGQDEVEEAELHFSEGPGALAYTSGDNRNVTISFFINFMQALLI